jgi:hypothetical protein
MGEVKVPERWAIRVVTISIGDELARAIGDDPDIDGWVRAAGTRVELLVREAHQLMKRATSGGFSAPKPRQCRPPAAASLLRQAEKPSWPSRTPAPGVG